MPKLHQMNEEEVVRRYLMLLLETNNRFDLLNAVHAGRLGMTDNFAAEYGFFQLRRICETMALGALTLHGDLEGVSANKFLREYHAQRIFNLLSRVHEHCFPQPVKRIEVGGEYLMFDCGPATCLANHLRSMSATLDLAKYTQAGIGRLRRPGRKEWSSILKPEC